MLKKLLLLTFIIGFQLCYANYRESYEFGMKLFNDGLYEEAVKEFQKVVNEAKTTPEAEESLYKLAECYKSKKQFKEAEENLALLVNGYANTQNLVLRQKTILFLAEIQAIQRKYAQAAQNYGFLIKQYPLSEFAGNSILAYTDALYKAQSYNEAILAVDDLVKNYPKSPLLPDLFIVQAQAYLANKMTKEGKDVLQKINKNYPLSNAKWQAVLITNEIMVQEKGLSFAAEDLANLLKSNIPRDMEEDFRIKLINYYLELKSYDKCLAELEKQMQKFNMSPRRDYYIYLQTKIRFANTNFYSIIADSRKHRDLLSNSPYYPDYLLLLGKAYLKNDDFDLVQVIFTDLQQRELSDSLKYQTLAMQADMLQKSGKAKDAVGIYQDLLNKYASIAQNEEILFKIGDIYFNIFQQYNIALKYYQQIITNYHNPAYKNNAFYKSYLCLEKMNDYQRALTELNQINLTSVEDSLFRVKIEKTRIYLERYKTKDFESAFHNLLTGLNAYLVNNDKDSLKITLSRILADDLQDYETSLTFFGKNDKTLFPEKAKLYLKLAERSYYESDLDKMTSYLNKADSLITKLNSETETSLILELQLDASFLKSNFTIGIQDVQKMESFIKTYPQTKAANRFSLRLISYYRTGKDTLNLVNSIKNLRKDEQISLENYQNLKLELAEYYYHKGLFSYAYTAYNQAGKFLGVDNPGYYYHYCLSMSKCGYPSEAIQKIIFLINNVDNFPEFDEAYDYLVSYYLEQKQYQAALKYHSLINEQKRDDKYYLTLFKIQTNVNNKFKAKEALLFVKNKDLLTLRILANLQYETQDYPMAEYTYNQLLKSSQDKISLQKDYAILGHLAFLQEKYENLITYYAPILNDLGEKPDFTKYPYLDLKQIAKENIIAYYRLDNRPKAETLAKKFKTLLETNSEIKFLIKMNEGIYYSKIDYTAANKIFTDLIDDKNCPVPIKEQTLFWRGLNYLQNKQENLAITDFKTLVTASDQDLRNQANFKLGTLFFSQQNFQMAMDYYYTVIQNDSTGKLALEAAKNFAIVCKTIGEWQKAITAYQTIISRWGDLDLTSETLFNIAFCYFSDKKYQSAVNMFEKTLPLLKDKEMKAEANYWIAESYFGLEQYPNAVTAFIKIGYNYSDVPRWASISELRAGESYLKMKKYEEAVSVFEKIVAKYGADSDIGKQAKKYLP